MNRTLAAVLLAAALHILLFFAAFTIKTAVTEREEEARAIRLVDVREQPPPPPPRPVQPQVQDVSDLVAEHVIETDEAPRPDSQAAGELIDFIPQGRVTRLPGLPEDEIRKRTVYPPIAQHSGLEGTVFLEIFVDRNGLVRNVSILKEDPEDRGFGEAAAKALLGMKGSPAIAGGEEAACRFRYRFRFQLTSG